MKNEIIKSKLGDKMLQIIDRAKEVNAPIDILKIPKITPIKALDDKQLVVARAFLTKLVDDTIGLFMQQKLSNAQLKFIAESFLSEDKYLSIEEVALIVKNGARGKYGRNYGNFRPDVIGDWFIQYREQIAIERENSHFMTKNEINAVLGLPQAQVNWDKISKLNHEVTERIFDEDKKCKKFKDVKDYCYSINEDYNNFISRKRAIWKVKYNELPQTQGQMTLGNFLEIKESMFLQRINKQKKIEFEVAKKHYKRELIEGKKVDQKPKPKKKVKAPTIDEINSYLPKQRK